jgi:para-nitrobenzyl esterase
MSLQREEEKKMAQSNHPIVATKSGKLQGIYEEGLCVFKGIPYATPPTGDLRWMPPQPVKPWSGTRSAEKFGPICPQILAQPMGIPRPSFTEEPQDEDCLFLNVWSPSLDNKRRAVMVWVHGGAFTNGSGSSPMHPGVTLPKRGDVVLVTVNYRLGPLGFLNLKQVTGGKIPASGNEGLLDQAAAVRWVCENIAAFGGDPENITVFGESAGAMSIGGLLAMPQAKRLFKKAILESGSNTCRPLDEASDIAEKYLHALGLTVKDTNTLRALPVEALLKAHQQMAAWGVRGAAMEPVVDGEVLPDYPLDAVKSGSAKNVTVLAGGNLNEGTLFLLPNSGTTKLDEAGLRKRVGHLVPEKVVPDLIEKYRQALAKRGTQPTPIDIFIAIQGDKQFRIPNIRLVEIQRDLGLPSFTYVLEWKSMVPGLGACHALDVGLIFGATYKEFHGSGPVVDRLARGMQEAWTAFARTGNPSSPTLGEWPAYGKERNTMLLGENSHVEAAPYEVERAAWEGIENKLLG